MTYEELFQQYKPKDEFVIYKLKSQETDKFIACVYKKVAVNRFKSEFCDASIAVITEKDFDTYFNKLQPYIQKRDESNNHGTI